MDDVRTRRIEPARGGAALDGGRDIAGAALEIVAQPDADQRTYRADFGKFARLFPQFEFQWNARRGARELAAAFRDIKLGRDGFTDRRFTRLKWLRHLLDDGLLDDSLRWREPRD